MINTGILVLSLVLSASCQNSPETSQKFLYQSSDLITIQPHNLFTLGLTLTTAADQYLSGAAVKATLQILDSQSSTLPYNLFYFNYENKNGQECYQTWISSAEIPYIQQCQDISNQTLDDLPFCAKYVNCSRQSRNLTLMLQDKMYRQSFFIIQNQNSQAIQIQTNIYLELSSENTWFYTGVGLTCLLLISLVIFTGVVFYWMLKYKRVKKMFEQFKLTEQAVSNKKQ